MRMLSAVVLGVFLSLLILLIISGNVLVCLAVCASRQLRCLTNCFIVSLAITDLLLGVLVLPFSALQDITGNWPLGPVFCNIYVSMDVMLCTASILNLLAISVDRYLAVTMPLRYASLVLPWRVAMAMLCVWTVSLAVSFLPIHLGWNTQDLTIQNRGPGDPVNQCRFELNGPYVVTDSLLTFYLPLVAMCWTYHRILRIARAQAKRVISARPARTTTGYKCGKSSTTTTATAVVSTVTVVALREHKATVTLAAVIGAFMVCWLPYFIQFMVNGWRKQQEFGTAYSVLLWLGYINSALNPILYAALNRDFRLAYARLLRCRRLSFDRGRAQQPFPITTARQQCMEVTLLCGHTPSTCRVGLPEQEFMLQEVNCTTATAAIQLSNGATTKDVNDNESPCFNHNSGEDKWEHRYFNFPPLARKNQRETRRAGIHPERRERRMIIRHVDSNV
ncbi:histamine receptor H2a [Lampris incognitus]|uniref:histamine receptor H2a n=1 Tax=Lampris incognitus TaxID=2546036 RepID=UPI0024B5BC07|nr:histamine receptor H2a [Lampris incognitus]